MATETINALNALNVRHVISDVLLRELLSSGNTPDYDKLLVKRVRQFRIPPYQTRDGLLWETLLYSGQDRVDYANLLHYLHSEMTKAESLSIMAQRATSNEETAEILEANKDVLEGLGFPKDFQANMPQVLSAAKEMLNTFGIDDLDWPENPTGDDFLDLQEQILERGRDIFGHSQFDYVEEEMRVRGSSTETENRPYQVATDRANDEVRKRLGNTLRDAEHIALFIHNRSEIDFLQVDSKHENIIRRKTPVHRLAELGLLERCFSAPSLLAAVNKVRELIQSEERR
jgi:hypothetical protein